MKKFLVMIICLILIAMCIPSISSTPDTATRADKPAEGATVMVTWTESSNTYTFTTEADAQGAYSVNVPPGSITVTTMLDGYIGDSIASFSIAGTDTETNDLFLIEMPEKTATVSGKIKDGSSAGIPNAMVTASWNNTVPVYHSFTATSDSNGDYSIEVPAGWITMVSASKDGFFYGFELVGSQIDNTDEIAQDIPLEEWPSDDATVMGMVDEDATSDPIPGAMVTIMSDVDAGIGVKYVTKTGETDGTGNYSVEIPAGNVTVMAGADGFLTKTLMIFTANSTESYYQNLSLEVLPDQTATVDGHVYLPKDTVAPEISNVAADPSGKKAVITWDTNEVADSKVYYGTNESNLDQEAVKGDFVTAHSVKIIDLTPETKYYFKVNSTDEGGNSAESAVKNFTTLTEDKTPPSIDKESIAAQNITKTGAKIVWDTDEDSKSKVVFGIAKETLDKTAENITMTKTHVVELTGLVAGTTYYYQVNSSDAEGNFNMTSDEPYMFTTLAEPSVVETGGVHGYVTTKEATKEDTTWAGNSTDMPLLVFDLDKISTITKLLVIQNDDDARGKEIKIMFDHGEDMMVTLTDNATVIQEFDMMAKGVSMLNMTVMSFYGAGNLSFSLVKIAFYGPVKGANVWLNDTTNATTDIDGYYKIEDADAGSYKMKITHGELETKESEYDIEIKKDSLMWMNFTVMPKSVEPPKTKVTIGPILDENDDPIKGAEVTVNGKTVETDAFGNAVFDFDEDDLDDSYSVKVEANDFEDLKFDVDIDANGTATPDTASGSIPQMKESGDDDGGLSPTMIAVIILIIIVLVVIGIVASRKGKAATTTPPPPPPDDEEEDEEGEEDEDEDEGGVSWEEDEAEGDEDEDEFEEEEDEEADEDEEEDEEEDEDAEGELDTMPCPKCGEDITIPSSERPIMIECDECGAKGKLTK